MESSSPSSPSTSVTASPSSSSAKRSREPEDEVYIDNLHSHKRYLSEIMASSLNCLTVGDSLPDHPMDSPARLESLFYSRDDASLQYSPMSDDSDDGRYYEAASINTCASQPESAPVSPVSPYRYPRSLGPPTTLNSSHGSVGTSTLPRQRGSESEGRFPSSPSDICHSGDLRRATLLRSVQMRAQPSGLEPVRNMEVEDRVPCLDVSVDRDYQIEDSSYSLDISESDNREKSCKMLDMNLKGDEFSNN